MRSTHSSSALSGIRNRSEIESYRTTASAPNIPHRDQLRKQVAQLDLRAKQAAEAGNITIAARTILESLDCERRAGATGLQVLQLIKPR